ncbi:hypothetical protein Scep_025754 [Stephania cephalantha]|uniref:Uncharacterized protein n=1 Tax=Stephania cephalantha TaxID=152367 RepID=A0AAP0EIS7_9MAGN
MTKRPPDRIPTDAVLDSQHSIEGGGGRAPVARGRRPSRGRGPFGRDQDASGDRGSLREGECPKGRVYGLRLLAKMKRRYEDLGARMRMDFGASTFQAPPPPPPPPPPQEHHQQVGMDLARSPHQQHDDDDEDIYDWLDEEHLGDESNSIMASYFHNYGQFEESYYYGVNEETVNAATSKSVEFDEFSIVDEYLSEPEETLEVSSHEQNITIAQNKDDEAVMKIKVILERPEEPQIESKEDQPLVLVKPLTLPCILVKP